MQRLRRFWLSFAVGLLLIGGVERLRAQANENAMSDAEVDKLREAAYVPVERINVFIKILDARSKAIETVLAKKSGRNTTEDLHQLFEEFGGIADELNDNLDAYGPKHRDLRKALPKLLLATERWSTALRAPADDAAYKVARKLALDAVRDVHDAAEAMQTEQEAYFKAHPEAAKADEQRTHPQQEEKPKSIDIPR